RCGRGTSAAWTPTTTGATSSTRSSRAPTRSGSWASRCSPTRLSRCSRASTCSTRRRSCRKSWPRSSRSACSLSTATPPTSTPETEQVAFHVGHLVPGIDVTDDPLLHARLFSYLDTQLTRLGGPNFGQIPINRPHAPVNDMHRDGFMQQGVHPGVAPYKPNSLDGGCPFFAGADGKDLEKTLADLPVKVAEGRKVRSAPASFDDHFSQVRLFWLSMTPIEQEHIIEAYTFELGKCYEQAIK